MNAHAIAKKLLDDGLELDSDEVRALAEEVARLHAQAKSGEPNIPAPPADRDGLRRAVEDTLDPSKERWP